MKRRLWCAAVLLCASCVGEEDGLPFYSTAVLTPEWTSPSAHRLSTFELRNQHGVAVRDSILDGRVSIVHFFFATCGGVCPATRSNLAALMRQVPDADVRVLSHSVQPERDSVAVLAAYAGMHRILDMRWQLLTGSRSEMERLARESYFVNLSDGRSYGTDQLAHTETVVLIDRQRHIRGVYNGTLQLDVDRLREDIAVLER